MSTDGINRAATEARPDDFHVILNKVASMASRLDDRDSYDAIAVRLDHVRNEMERVGRAYAQQAIADAGELERLSQQLRNETEALEHSAVQFARAVAERDVLQQQIAAVDRLCSRYERNRDPLFSVSEVRRALAAAVPVQPEPISKMGESADERADTRGLYGGRSGAGSQRGDRARHQSDAATDRAGADSRAGARDRSVAQSLDAAASDLNRTGPPSSLRSVPEGGDHQ